MKVTHYPKTLNTKYKTTLILGSFETIHNGHLELINTARKLGKRIAIMLMDNPKDLPGFNKEKEFTSLNIRLQQLANLQVDFASVVKYDKHVALLEGKDFIKTLMKSVNASHIVIGKDFKCGRGGSFAAKDIVKEFKDVTVVEHKKINEKKISSSLLKEFLTLGEVDLVKKLSPFAYTIEAKVNSKNIVDISMYPKLHSGIYASSIIVNEIEYWALVHISQSNVATIKVPDLQLKNSPYKGSLSLHKLIRIIVSSREDNIKDTDLENVAFYLKNNI